MEPELLEGVGGHAVPSVTICRSARPVNWHRWTTTSSPCFLNERGIPRHYGVSELEDDLTYADGQ